MVRKGLTDKVTSKQRPEECWGANQVAISGNRILSKGNSSAKHLRSSILACLRSVAGIDWVKESGRALKNFGFHSETGASGGLGEEEWYTNLPRVLLLKHHSGYCAEYILHYIIKKAKVKALRPTGRLLQSSRQEVMVLGTWEVAMQVVRSVQILDTSWSQQGFQADWI